MDPTAQADGMFNAIRGWMARELVPYLERIKSLEERRPADGKDGRDGRDGRDGSTGRDAADIVILDGIDPSKSYPGGTFAAHDGGLIRSVRVTDPIDGDLAAAGWRVVVNGMKGFDVQMEDGGRVLKFVVSGTAGDIAYMKRTAIPVERGIHRDGKGYENGDVVEWGGDAWIATKDAPEGKPGVGEGWRRLVRRGREGKPAQARVGA